MAVGVRHAGFDVRLVAGRVQAQVQRAVAAVAQAEEAQGRHVDLVHAVGEVVDRVGGRHSASGVVTVAVLDAGVAEGVGTFAAVKGVATCAAVDDVRACAGANGVVAAQPEDQVGACGARDRFAIVGAGDGAGRRIGHGQGKTITD